MDIIAHGLWSAAAYAGTNKKLSKGKTARTLNVWAGALWGIFPDLFAFTIPWIWIGIDLLRGAFTFQEIPGPASTEPPLPGAFPISIFNLASSLYNISHSAIVFGAVFLAVWAIRKTPLWEMGGWLLHILIDIPTHSYSFFPTPAPWPLSQWKFSHGIQWNRPWFMVLNYSLLALIFGVIYLKPLLSKNKRDDKTSASS